MTLKAFYHEAQVQVGETPLCFVVNFKTIDAIEGQFPSRQMPDILPGILMGTAPHSDVAKVIWGLLRVHNPEVTPDEAMSLVYDKENGAAVGLVIGDLFRRAFNIALPEKAKAKNPRKPRGASKPS